MFLINNMEVDIQIMPHDDDFMILAPVAGDTNRYKVEFEACRLHIKHVDLMDGLSLDIARKLETTPAKYALRKTMMKSFFISAGRREFNSNLFAEQVPRRVTLGLVSNDAYIGAKGKSPFMFEPFDVRELTITANGRNYPSVPYDLDYANNLYTRAFHDMNDAVGLSNSYDSNGISMGKYKTGWCIYVFNMTNSLEDDQCFDLIKNGTTSIGIKFSQPVPEGGITLIVMGEVDSLLTMDVNRTITSDSSV